MRMYQDHIKCFPKFADLVSKALPLVAYDTAMMNSIQKAAGNVKGDLVKNALIWRRLPWVVPDDMDVSGAYTPFTNTIRVNYLRILEYQAGQGRETDDGRAITIVTAIILHELTHWADWNYDKKPVKGEAGFAFEKLAYGANAFGNVSLPDLRAKFGQWNSKWEVHPVE